MGISIIKGSQLLTPDPVMKIVLFTLCVLVVMCSPVQSQSRERPKLARPTPPPQASQLVQQSALRFIPPGDPILYVYDGRCGYTRVHSQRQCPMAYKFELYRDLCNDTPMCWLSTSPCLSASASASILSSS